MENQDSNYKRKYVKGTSPHIDKPLAVFQIIDGKTRIFYQDKNKVYHIKPEKFKKMRSNPRSSNYLLIKFNKRKYKTIQEQLKDTVTEGLFLKELTNGKINLFRTGSVAKTSMQLFYDLNEEPDEPEPISEKENEFLLKAINGAMIWAKPYKGKGYKYDVVSEYPSIMISKNLKIPYGGVTFHKITNKELREMGVFKYGIYHCKVHYPDERLFRVNDNNFYTHTDLNYVLNHLKYKLEMIEDGEDNAMIYSNLKSARSTFKPFVDYLFNFKNQGVKEVKNI